MIYSLTKNNYSIEVSSLGAELISLKKNNVNYLWTKTQPWWQRHAPVLFPIVGKLRGNTYLYDEKEYSLPQHGFARDSKFELIEETKGSLLFRLTDNKNPNYPFAFDFFIKYNLDDHGIKTTYIVENKGNEILPFSVGAHPGFLCPFHKEETLEDYYFEFDDDDTLNRTLLKEGLLLEDTRTITLDKKKLVLSEKLFNEDALVLSGFKSKSVALKSKNYALKISWEDCTYLGLWKQPNAPFVCIEPWWGVADRVVHNRNIIDKKGINILEPGTKKEFWFGIEIL
jgi:galactose mutarotase-like enzyme